MITNEPSLFIEIARRIGLRKGSEGTEAAVDLQVGGSNKGSLRAGKPQYCGGNLMRLADSTKRMTVGQP